MNAQLAPPARIDPAPSFAAGMTAEALRHQLHCYAQDLQSLITQYSQLHECHQIALQSLDLGYVREDLLLNALLASADAFFVTNQQADILYASPGANRLIDPAAVAQSPGSLLHWMSPAHAYQALLLLKEMARHPGEGAAVLDQLVLLDANQTEVGHRFDALILQVRKQGRIQIYWLLSNQASRPDSSATDQLCAFVQAGEASLFVADLAGNICAVNKAFTLSTGHTQAEVLGKNARLINAQPYDTEQHDTVRRALQATGSWSGKIFLRRSNDQIYLAPMTYKTISNLEGQAIGYMAAFLDRSPPQEQTGPLTHVALHDPLTGLPNRTLFENQLALAMADVGSRSSGLYLLLVELPSLKSMPLEFGTELANQLVKKLNGRLQSAVRRADSVARLCEDRFAVLLPGVANPVDAISIANAIMIHLHAAIQAGPHRLTVAARLGGACFAQDAADVASLLNCAQAALEGARRQSTGVCFYQPGMLTSTPQDADLAPMPKPSRTPGPTH